MHRGESDGLATRRRPHGWRAGQSSTRPVLFILAGLVALALRGRAAGTPDALLASLQPQGLVSDYAHALSDAQRAALVERLGAVRQRTGAEIAVVTLDSLDGGNIDDFTHALFNRWGVGQKGKDNGVMLLVALKDRKGRIEVGYGLEPVIPDALAGRILRESIFPSFKKGQYAEGLSQGAARIAELVERGQPAGPAPRGPRTPLLESVGLCLFFSIFVAAGSFAVGYGAGMGLKGVFLAVWGTVFCGIPLTMAYKDKGMDVTATAALGIVACAGAVFGFVKRRAEARGSRSRVTRTVSRLVPSRRGSVRRRVWRRADARRRTRKHGYRDIPGLVMLVSFVSLMVGANHGSPLLAVIIQIIQTFFFCPFVLVGGFFAGAGLGSRAVVPALLGALFGIGPIVMASVAAGRITAAILGVLWVAITVIGFLSGRSDPGQMRRGTKAGAATNGWVWGVTSGGGGGGDGGGFSSSDSGGFSGGSSGGGGASGSW